MEEELLREILPWVEEMRLSLIQSNTIGATDNPDDIPEEETDVRQEVDFLTSWLEDVTEVLRHYELDNLEL